MALTVQVLCVLSRRKVVNALALTKSYTKRNKKQITSKGESSLLGVQIVQSQTLHLRAGESSKLSTTMVCKKR